MRIVTLVMGILMILPVTFAQVQIGTPGSNGLIPKIHISTNIPGQMAQLTVENVASQAQIVYILISFKPWREDFSAAFGPGAILSVRPLGPGQFLILQLQPGGSFDFPVPGGLPIIYMQAVAIDPGGQGGIAISAPYAYTNSHPVSTIIGSLPAATPAAPRGIFSSTMVIDPLTGIMYIFGGSYSIDGHLIYTVDNVVEINPHNPVDLQSRIVAHCPYRVYLAVAVWDSRRSKAYIFSGSAADPPYPPRDQIMEYNPDTNQCILLPDRLPSYDSAISGTYDPVADVVYLFGWSTTDNRVTVYDLNLPPGSRIRRLLVSPPSGPFYVENAARDPRTGVIYAFGNRNISPRNWIGQLYQFIPGGQQGGTFTLLTTIPLRSDAAEAFNPVTGKFYLIGGNIGPGPRENFLCDNGILAFDPNNPSQGFVRVGQLPEGRWKLKAVADPVTGLLVVAGGMNYGLGSPDCGPYHHPEIVAFNPQTGQAYNIQALPSVISRSAAVRDPNRRITYLVGGSDSQYNPLDTILAFQETNMFTPINMLADRFSTPFSGAAAAWNGNKILVFGGSDSQYNPLASIYEINPSAPAGSQIRLQQEVLPSGISNAVAITDPANQNVYVFGGNAPGGTLQTIQQWDPARPASQRLRTLSAQLPREFAFGAGAYNTNDQSMYLFGGSTSALNIIKFTPATGQAVTLPEILPNGRTGLNALFDPARGTFLLFGGYTTGSGPTDEILEYNPVTHQIQVVSRLPSARDSGSTVFSPEMALNLYLGGAYYGQQFNDIFGFAKD